MWEDLLSIWSWLACASAAASSFVVWPNQWKKLKLQKTKTWQKIKWTLLRRSPSLPSKKDRQRRLWSDKHGNYWKPSACWFFFQRLSHLRCRLPLLTATSSPWCHLKWTIQLTTASKMSCVCSRWLFWALVRFWERSLWGIFKTGSKDIGR